MIIQTKHNGRIYTATSPTWSWRSDKGNIVTSRALIQKLNKKFYKQLETRKTANDTNLHTRTH